MVLVDIAVYEEGSAHIEDNMCEFVGFKFDTPESAYVFINTCRRHYDGDIDNVNFTISFKTPVCNAEKAINDLEKWEV